MVKAALAFPIPDVPAHVEDAVRLERKKQLDLEATTVQLEEAERQVEFLQTKVRNFMDAATNAEERVVQERLEIENI